MSEVRLRPATAADAAAVAALHVANWREAYRTILAPAYLAGPIEAERRAVWDARLARPAAGQEVILAETGAGALAGFVCLYHGADPRWGGFIDNLHSAAAVRGSGVGERLLRTAARSIAGYAPEAGLWLWVFADNRPARGFYERMGGQVVEEVLSDWAVAAGKMHLRTWWPSAVALAAG